MTQLFPLFKVNYITHKGTMICTPQKKCWRKGSKWDNFGHIGNKTANEFGVIDVKKWVLW